MSTHNHQTQQQQQIDVQNHHQDYPKAANFEWGAEPPVYHDRNLSHAQHRNPSPEESMPHTRGHHQRAISTPNFAYYPTQYNPHSKQQPQQYNYQGPLYQGQQYQGQGYMHNPLIQQPASSLASQMGFSGAQKIQPVPVLKPIVTTGIPKTKAMPAAVKVECIDRLNVLQFEQYMHDKFRGHLDSIMQTLYRQTQNWTSSEIQRLLADQNSVATEAMSSRLLNHMHVQLPMRLRATISLALHQMHANQQENNFHIFFQLMRVLLVSGADCFIHMTIESIRKHLLTLFDKAGTDAESSCCGDQGSQSDLPEVLKQNISCMNEARRMILETWEMALLHMKGHCKDSQKMSKNDVLVMAAVMAQYIIKPVHFETIIP